MFGSEFLDRLDRRRIGAVIVLELIPGHVTALGWPLAVERRQIGKILQASNAHCQLDPSVGVVRCFATDPAGK
jgi:hypothetical protein